MSNVVNLPSKFYGALASALLVHIIMAELFVTQSPTFKSEDVIPSCFHSNETSLAECVSLISTIFFPKGNLIYFFIHLLWLLFRVKC